MHSPETFTLVVVVACALAIGNGLAAAQQNSDSVAKLKDGFDVNVLDRNIDPCVDFYHYACGTWLKENPVPPDRSVYGRFTELAERNRLILRDVLEKASVPNPGRSANEQKIGDYYASCMDESNIEKKGTAVLRPELARIDAIKGRNELPSLLAICH